MSGWSILSEHQGNKKIILIILKKTQLLEESFVQLSNYFHLSKKTAHLSTIAYNVGINYVHFDIDNHRRHS